MDEAELMRLTNYLSHELDIPKRLIRDILSYCPFREELLFESQRFANGYGCKCRGNKYVIEKIRRGEYGDVLVLTGIVLNIIDKWDRGETVELGILCRLCACWLLGTDFKVRDTIYDCEVDNGREEER